MPKITIIEPVYNVEKYIDKNIKSIKNQGFDDFECLLINDGSTDKSVDVALQAINNDNRFKIYNKENGGVSSARNYGIEKTKGDYLVFVDPDDVISPLFLNTLYENIEKYNTDISICNYKFIKSLEENLNDEGGNVEIYNTEEFLNHFLIRDKSFVLVSMLIKTELIRNNCLTFDERIRFSEDQMYMWDLIINSNSISYTNQKLYGYYLRESSTMTSSSKNKILDSYPYVKEKLSSFDFDKYPYLKYVLPRWELGSLYTSAKLLSYEEFVGICSTMNGSSIYNRLKGFNEFKATALAFVLSVSKHFFYNICKVI